MDYEREFSTNKVFTSREDLVEWARQVGRLNGFVIVTLRSDKGSGKKRAGVTLGCERSGKCDKRTPETEIKNRNRRHTGTKKCGCPFQLKGKKLATLENSWVLVVVHGKHNHAVEHWLGGRSSAGTLSLEEKRYVMDFLPNYYYKPKEILSMLQEKYEDIKSTPRTIYNARQRITQNEKARMQQLMKSNLSKYSCIQKHRSCSVTDTVLDFFWTHPTSLELLRAFPRVLIVIGTYLTRTYSVLEIDGVTSTNLTFSAGFAFLSSTWKECYDEPKVSKDSYEWALSTMRGVMDDSAIVMPDVILSSNFKDAVLLKAIRDVFATDTILYPRCFINVDVKRYCWKVYEGKDTRQFRERWERLIATQTAEGFEQELKQLHADFSMYPKALRYVTDTLLKRYKEKFVAAWTDKCMHFGNTSWIWDALSPCDDCYYACLTLGIGSYEVRVLEQYMVDSFWEQLHDLREKEYSEIKASFVDSLAEANNKYMPWSLELKELLGVVSTWALQLVHQQIMIANRKHFDQTVCTCVIRSTHGIPCAHEILKYKRDGRPIPLECIDPHWRKLDLGSPGSTSESALDGRILLNMNDNIASPSALPICEVVELREGNSSVFELAGCDLPIEEVYQIQSANPLFENVNSCSAVLSSYVLEVKDMGSDGHCGFRGIALLLGNSDEDGWVKVRNDLTIELKLNLAYYAQLFGSEQKINELLHALAYFDSTCIPREHWMTLPDMGHIIASCYNVVLIYLSSAICATFFPLRTAPISVSAPLEIAIGFQNDHYMQVFLKPGHPIPPIAPAMKQKTMNVHHVATDWERVQEQRSALWSSAYVSRIEHFKSILTGHLSEEPSCA